MLVSIRNNLVLPLMVLRFSQKNILPLTDHLIRIQVKIKCNDNIHSATLNFTFYKAHFLFRRKNGISMGARRVYLLDVQALAPTINAYIFIRQIQCNPLWWRMTMHFQVPTEDGPQCRLRRFVARAAYIGQSSVFIDRCKQERMTSGRKNRIHSNRRFASQPVVECEYFIIFNFFRIFLRPKWNTIWIVVKAPAKA